MTVVKGVGKEKTDIKTQFYKKSIVDKEVLKSTDRKTLYRILPELNVIKIGGQSIIDRGAPALFPILDEIVECTKKYQILLCTGGGTRARHVYSLCLDLGLPTGVLAHVGGKVPTQNARLLQMLLAKHGGIRILYDEVEKLPLYLRLGCIPILEGMPPYTFWETIPEFGRIPPHRTDSGTFFMGEFYGARNVLYVKDERGLYTDDPKKNPKAEFIPKISVQELLERNLKDLVVEHEVLINMLRAKNVKQIQVINGLVKGNIKKALAGKHVGTIIYTK
ncbi:MAG: uridine kinase [Candidatus Altiarchaeota archaeon]|nr:uridine kinase [Candidatus Altiarchaeota archaeon]